jgi:hypothetical protein
MKQSTVTMSENIILTPETFQSLYAVKKRMFYDSKHTDFDEFVKKIYRPVIKPITSTFLKDTE